MGGAKSWEGVAIEALGLSGGIWTVWNPRSVEFRKQPNGAYFLATEFRGLASNKCLHASMRKV